MIEKAVHEALSHLGIAEYVMRGTPTNEEEFLHCFRKVVGEDAGGSAIESADPADFGVTWTEIQTTMDELAAIKVATAYREDRRNAYPSIGDQLDALFHHGAFPDDMAATLQAVKTAHPKPAED